MQTEAAAVKVVEERRELRNSSFFAATDASTQTLLAGSLARQACKAVCLLTRGSSEKVKIKFLFSFCEWLLRFPSVGRCPQFLCGGGSRQISGLNEELEMKEMRVRDRQTERHSSSNGNGMERSLSGPCLFSISMQQQQSAEMEELGKYGRTRRTMFRG